MLRTLFILCLASPAYADVSHYSVVRIECETAEGETVFSTGAIVSGEGHVLTARHGAKSGWRCSGRRGERGDLVPLSHVADSSLDAALWRFEEDGGRDFVPLRFVPMDASLKKREIFAAGFPKESPDEISWRRGVISTADPTDGGLIETDVHTAGGMSGGPVMLHDYLIGIVAGARFDALGLPTDFAVLTASSLPKAFNLLEADLSEISVVPKIDGVSQTAVSVLNWSDAAEQFQREKGAAISCAQSVKKRLPAGDMGLLRIEQNYETARTEMNALLARLDVALIEDEEDAVFVDLTKRLARVSTARDAFCRDAEQVLAALSQGGEKFLGPLLQSAGSLADAAVKVWLEFRGGDRTRRNNLRTALEDAKWPAFKDI